ncbi:MAG: 1-acyl-sn-glycerol-3-phosphate acyltransferase [Chitinophagaceae bacterium]
MSIIKNILGRIFAVWALLSFVLTFLIIFIPSMFCWLIPDPKGQKIFIQIARLWMNVWLRITGCSVRIKGKSNFRTGETFIVTSNHNSLMDIPLSSPFIPGANKTIAKSTFTKVPLFGFYYMKGSVLVNRNNDKSRRQSFEKMKAVLKQGIHICIYPEGTRNRTSEPLKKFYDGAFKLAVETKKSIIPTVIFNTKKVLPVNKVFYFWPHRIEMHFLEPVAVQNKKSDELKKEVSDVMKAYYVQHKTN